jgi:hypothetical protein
MTPEQEALLNRIVETASFSRSASTSEQRASYGTLLTGLGLALSAVMEAQKT